VRPAPVHALIPALALLAGCPVGVALPPARAEVAPVATVGPDSGTSLRVSAGSHWASGDLDHARNLDVGGGYVYERAFARASDANDSHGGYLELHTRVAAGGSWRAWVGLRGELAGGERRFGGAAARASWELTAPAYGATPFEGRCAFGVAGAYGRIGVGVYAEGGVRQYSDDRAVTVTAGLSLRLPAVGMLALILPIPGC
jgi:hypothetical protein